MDSDLEELSSEMKKHENDIRRFGPLSDHADWITAIKRCFHSLRLCIGSVFPDNILQVLCRILYSCSRQLPCTLCIRQLLTTKREADQCWKHPADNECEWICIWLEFHIDTVALSVSPSSDRESRLLSARSQSIDLAFFNAFIISAFRDNFDALHFNI